MTQRASIPDIHLPLGSSSNGGGGNGGQQQQVMQFLLFDSLASLPTQLPAHLTTPPQQHREHREQQQHKDKTQPPQLPQQPPPQAVARSAGVAVQDSSRGNKQADHEAAAKGDQQLALPAPSIEDLQVVSGFLRHQLGLTLFGFDVVATQSSSGGDSSSGQQQRREPQQQLVVIDVNYFPNYRGGNNAPVLFRAALMQCWQQHRELQ